MKISKLPIIGGIITLAIALILTWFPTFAMNQIKLSIANSQNLEIPTYKLQESPQFWEIANLTIFQPLSLLLFIIAAILLIYGIMRTLASRTS